MILILLYIKSGTQIQLDAAVFENIILLDQPFANEIVNLGHIRKWSVHPFGHNKSAKLEHTLNYKKYQKSDSYQKKTSLIHGKLHGKQHGLENLTEKISSTHRAYYSM